MSADVSADLLSALRNIEKCRRGLVSTIIYCNWFNKKVSFYNMQNRNISKIEMRLLKNKYVFRNMYNFCFGSCILRYTQVKNKH